MSPGTRGKWCDNGRVNVACGATQFNNDVHTCSFSLTSPGGMRKPWDGLFNECLGACVCGDKVR